MIALVSSTAIAQNSSWLGSPSNTLTTNAPTTAASTPSQVEAAPANLNMSSGNAGFFESGTFERRMDKVFDTDKDSFDFENGTLNWKGKTFNMGDSRLVRARFERYLAMPSNDQDYAAYQAILSEIVARLSASNDRLPYEDVRDCWSKLFDAAEYDVDGKSSLTIANLVYLSWRMSDELKATRGGIIGARENVKAKENFLKRKADFLEFAADKISFANKKNSAVKRTRGTTELVHSTQELQKAVAELSAKETSVQLTAAKAVFLYQSQILTFLMERKFQQAQIAAMFYRHIYRGASQELVVGKEQINQLFNVSNFVPSVDMFENIATEARKDIADGMNAVNALYNKGHLYGVLERLMETFAIGEFDSALAIFPTDKRIDVLRVYKDISALKSLADSKDYGAMVEILENFKKIAPDFPIRETLAKVRTAQRLSDMHLMAAKQSAALGKANDVKASLAEAMKVWPLNPAINEFNKDLVGLASGASRYVQKFDELLARKNYREIMSESPEYAIAFRNDTQRAEALKSIVVKISQIDTIIAQAEEFSKQNNKYLAWDILENARVLDSKDPKLALMIASIAPDVSDYVKMLGKASESEKNGDFAMALNYYISAREIFPASQACRLGIERVAEKYMQ